MGFTIKLYFKQLSTKFNSYSARPGKLTLGSLNQFHPLANLRHREPHFCCCYGLLSRKHRQVTAPKKKKEPLSSNPPNPAPSWQLWPRFDGHKRLEDGRKRKINSCQRESQGRSLFTTAGAASGWLRLEETHHSPRADEAATRGFSVRHLVSRWTLLPFVVSRRWWKLSSRPTEPTEHSHSSHSLTQSADEGRRTSGERPRPYATCCSESESVIACR